MAGSLIERTLGVLELLADAPDGLPVQQLAERLAIPKSAAHRICHELIRLGYVRQQASTQRYQLTPRLGALGLRHLSATGATDMVQPILDRLAEESGELVRLAVAESCQLTWVAKAQGARSGLRYDPDMGRTAPLTSIATGQAWLSCFDDQQALALVSQQTGTALALADQT